MFLAREGDNRGFHPSGWGAVTLAADAFKRKFEGAGTNVLSATKILRHIATNRTADAARGKAVRTVRCGRVLKSVRGT